MSITNEEKRASLKEWFKRLTNTEKEIMWDIARDWKFSKPFYDVDTYYREEE